MIMQKDYKALS